MDVLERSSIVICLNTAIYHRLSTCAVTTPYAPTYEARWRSHRADEDLDWMTYTRLRLVQDSIRKGHGVLIVVGSPHRIFSVIPLATSEKATDDLRDLTFIGPARIVRLH